jgi:hypothetical protein
MNRADTHRAFGRSLIHGHQSVNVQTIKPAWARDYCIRPTLVARLLEIVKYDTISLYKIQANGKQIC